MQKYEENLASRLNGNALQPLALVEVRVTDDATGLPAALYSDDGVTSLPQPLITDNNGGFAFYAANGEYTLTFSSQSITTFTRKIILDDPSDNKKASLAELAAPSGASLIGHMASGTGAVTRTLQEKSRDFIDAADYITTPGASDALDMAGVQKAIDLAAVKGGRVRVRKPIRNVWDLSSLTIPANVVIDDERNIDIGHTAMYGTGGDIEMRVHGASVTGGEGPSFVAVNNATSGDRTASIVARYGAGIGSVVTAFVHFGWWTGSVWKKVVDFITEHADGFRSNLRLGFGAVIVNPSGTGENIDPEVAATNSLAFAVNNRADDGGGSLLKVFKGRIVAPPNQDVQIHGGALRLMNAAGDQRFSLIPDFPSVGQVTLYDQIAGKAMATFTSGGTMSIGMNGISISAVTAASVGTNCFFVDSADGKAKFKDSGGVVNALY